MSKPSRWILVVLLICCSVAVQAWVIGRAPVPALDAVRVVEVARRIERQGVPEVLRGQREQALFSAWVWAVHRAAGRFARATAANWALAAQLAAATGLVLAVVPVYLIACRLFGPGPGLAGAVVFCCLPEVSRLGVAGIGDSVHLLFFAWALWAVLQYWDGPWRRGADHRATKRPSGSPLWLMLAGILAAVALMFRSEILVFVVAVAACLLAFQCYPAWRRSAKAVVVAYGCFGLGLAVAFVPYLAVLDSLSLPHAVARAMGRYEVPDVEAAGGRLQISPFAWSLADGTPMAFDPKEPSQSIRRRGAVAAICQFGVKLADLFGYGIGLFALLSVWLLRRQLNRPADRFCHVYLALYTAAAVAFAAHEGYLAPRHLLPWLVIGSGAVGHGLLVAGRAVAVAGLKGERLASGAAWAAVLVAAAACLVALGEPFNSTQRGHRQAAEWLAHRPPAGGVVLDTRGWTGLYSGRPTVRYSEGPSAWASPRLAYVVVEAGELRHASCRARTLRTLLQAAGRPVRIFPAGPADEGCRVVIVYRWDPQRFAHWLAGQAAGLQPASATTGLLNTPIPSISTSTTSPGLSSTGG